MENRAEWNLLIHLAADFLAARADAILADLTRAVEQVGNGKVNVFVETVKGQGKATRTRFIGGKGEKDEDLPPVNTGDPQSLCSFLKWGAEVRAQRTAVFLFGHGNGVADWVPKKAPSSPNSYIDALTIPELGEGFARARKSPGPLAGPFAIIGMNACLMSMVEVAYELRSFGEVMIGSELVDSDTGWPYGEILRGLVKNPEMPTDDLAGMILKAYETCSTRTEARVLGAVRLDTNALRIDAGQYIDLVSLLTELRAQGVDVEDGLRQVKEALFEPVKRGAGDACGLSMYFPVGDTDPNHLSVYRKIAFARDTGWADYLKTWLEPSNKARQARRKYTERAYATSSAMAAGPSTHYEAACERCGCPAMGRAATALPEKRSGRGNSLRGRSAKPRLTVRTKAPSERPGARPARKRGAPRRR